MSRLAFCVLQLAWCFLRRACSWSFDVSAIPRFFGIAGATFPLAAGGLVSCCIIARLLVVVVFLLLAPWRFAC